VSPEQARLPDSSRVAVISAHLDDAIFSVGAGIAAIARKGMEVEVITVLAGDPDQAYPAGSWDRATGFRTSGEAARVRREEDRRACQILGARPVWFPFHDEQYLRGGSDEEIGERLRSHLMMADAVLVPGYPLSHPDHAWASALVLAMGLQVPVGLYAEQPYLVSLGHSTYRKGVGGWILPPIPAWLPPAAASNEGEAESSASETDRAQLPRLSESPSQGWPDLHGRWLPLRAGTKDRRAKRAAREAYRSQLPRLSESHSCGWPVLRRRIDRVESGVGGELVAWVSSVGDRLEPTPPPVWSRAPSSERWRRRSRRDGGSSPGRSDG
jgi:LmbE family N-acetylglucosaminyl deacetylase